MYMYLYSPSFSLYSNQIDIKFILNKMVQGKDYDLTYHFNKDQELYIIQLQFGGEGIFDLGGLSINSQILTKYKGYRIYVTASKCVKVKLMQKHKFDQIIVGQNLTMVFSCLDKFDRPIQIGNLGVFDVYEALKFIIITNDTTQNFYSGKVRLFQKIPSQFVIQETMVFVGNYSLTIYYQNEFMKQRKVVHQIWDSINVITGACEKNKDWNRCVNDPEHCAPDYYSCQMISKSCKDKNLLKPFECQDATGSLICVENASQCCQVSGSTTDTKEKWCQSLEECIPRTSQCCDWNQTHPIRCNSLTKQLGQQKCVANQFECCGDLTYGSDKKPLVKCSNENKCVPEDTDKYCFEPFNVTCKEVLGYKFLNTVSETKYQCTCEDTAELFNDFSLFPSPCGWCQCKNDGKCKSAGNNCANSHVCPLGYTMCPDGVCIIGSNNFDACIDWSQKEDICNVAMYNNQSAKFIQCPGSYSQCATSYEECPNHITCHDPSQVICPDGTCKNNSAQCHYTDDIIIKNTTSFLCNDANKYKCPGIDMCAQRPDLCPNSQLASYVSHKTCPVDYQLCQSGICAINCQEKESTVLDISYATDQQLEEAISNIFENEFGSFFNGLPQYMIKCPQSNELRIKVSDCPSQKLCASNWRFNYGPVQKKICQGNQKCVDRVSECDYSFCEDPFTLSFTKNLTGQHFTICHDGKCAFQNNKVLGISPNICMTPFSCSDHFFKVDTSVGEFCFDQNTLSDIDSKLNLVNNINFIAHMLDEYRCNPKQIKCLNGVCVDDILHCPTQITCPFKTHPHRCQDGQCVQHLNLCSYIDNQVIKQLKRCTSFGLLLCQTDLMTCVSSLESCPNSIILSFSCNKFQIMCWDGTCVDSFEQCPMLHKAYLSSCHSRKGTSYHGEFIFRDPINFIQCPLQGECVKFLENCTDPQTVNRYWPTQTEIILNNKDCKYDCKDGCLQHPCPEWMKCPNQDELNTPDGNGIHNISIYCWNGECVNNLDYCNKKLDNKSCQYEDQFCYNDYEIECLNSYPNYIEGYIQPSDKCYVPRCPPNKPVKCPNGLCVTDYKSCAAVPFSKVEVDYCYNYNQQLKSKFGNINRYIPCGNGKCVSSLSQCQPLLDCEDIDPILKVRCSYDGTCKSHTGACTKPKVKNQDGSRQQYCPYHAPYICNSGQCAKSKDHCIQWWNGCPRMYPFKCPFSGLCVLDLNYCSVIPVSTQIKTQVNDYESILATPITAKESTISFCKWDQFLCNINHNVQQYKCVDYLNQCIDYESGCPVNLPIKCGDGKCYSNFKMCSNQTLVDQATLNTLSDNPLIGLKQYEGYEPNTQILSNGCNIINSVRCNWVKGENFMCKRSSIMLDDYFSDEKFVDMNSCYPVVFQNKQAEINQINPQFKNQLVNQCKSQLNPISCQSGECVSDVNQCRTCLFGCTDSLNHQCVADSEICEKSGFISVKDEFDYVKPSKFCPENQPVRCITDGICVGSAIDCFVTKNTLNSLRDARFELINPLISSMCNSQKPIRCATGVCVKNSNDCINDKRQSFINISQTETIENMEFQKALKNPSPIMLLNYSTAIIHYVSQNSYKLTVKPNPCAVICQDGSCRDNQLNCPQINSCLSPMIVNHNIRCRNGFCQNQRTCKTVEPCEGETQRCEDGSCREYCLAYFGCPVETPYQCQDGSCAQHSEQCFDLSCNVNGSKDNKYGNKTRCRNGDCLLNTTGLLCPQSIPIYQYQVKQIQYSVNVLLNNTIDFLFDIYKQPIGNLFIPSGSMVVTQTQDDVKKQVFTYHYIQRIVINGIPDSILSDMQNEIVKDRVEQIQKDFYPLIELKYLPQFHSLLAPVVQIQNLDEKVQESDINGRIKRTNMAQAVYLKFKIDVDHFPNKFNYSLDSCLGIKQNQQWLCIGRDQNLTLTSFINETNSTLITYPIYQPGIYAYIINPQPKVAEEKGIVKFLILRNTKQWFIILGVFTLFVVIMLICGVFMLNEKRRKVAQQIHIDHDLKGDKHTNIVKDFLKKTGVDKMKLIENLIVRIKKTEAQRLKMKNYRKQVDNKHKQQMIKQQQMTSRIRKMKAQAANDQSIDIEDELLNDDYLNDTISAYEISVNKANKHHRHANQSSSYQEHDKSGDDHSQGEGIHHYDSDEEEQKVDMYKLAKQYTKSVIKQNSPDKEKTQKKAMEIMKIQQRALLMSISNFQKKEGFDKRETKTIRQSLANKLNDEMDTSDIINSVIKKKKFFKVRMGEAEQEQYMNTRQLMDKQNDRILDKYLDQIDGHNSLLQGSIIDDRQHDSEESASSFEEIKEEEN